MGADVSRLSAETCADCGGVVYVALHFWYSVAVLVAIVGLVHISYCYDAVAPLFFAGVLLLMIGLPDETTEISKGDEK